ncbi:MAG: zinc carboxypeptidase [Gammaproteobacteria bacterium]|nr:zinc carboxypeptidase [Gammaproteobacteria bacterium]
MPENLPELQELERLMEAGRGLLDARVVASVTVANRRLPIYALSMGCARPDAPAIGYFGGVHGLERIGSRILLSFLHSLIARSRWDSALQELLSRVRLVFMPIVNPGGMWRNTRCNTRGVDLMRNAPQEAEGKVPFLVGGQRFSAWLPWYRGPAQAPMEIESQAVAEVVRSELLSRPFSLALDCHSGFGLRDRLWFPYAGSGEPLAHLAEVYAIKQLFDETYPHHNYLLEPQCHHYRAHGDLWDFLYRQALSTANTFLPLTLEMGSWLWVKKNPRQLFSRLGIFNPIPAHRLQRVLRGHLVLLDFLLRVTLSHERWLPAGEGRGRVQRDALALWFPEHR